MGHRQSRGSMVGCITLGAVLLLAAGGCTQGITTVKSAYGPGIKFSGFGSTFDWWPGAGERTGDPRIDNPEVHRGLRDLIAEGFIAKGYRRSTADTPDFWVDYQVSRRTRGGLREANWAAVYEEGTLVIDLLDPGTGKHIWRGYAVAKLNDELAPSERRKRTELAVKKILARFPSQGEE